MGARQFAANPNSKWNHSLAGMVITLMVATVSITSMAFPVQQSTHSRENRRYRRFRAAPEPQRGPEKDREGLILSD